MSEEDLAEMNLSEMETIANAPTRQFVKSPKRQAEYDKEMKKIKKIRWSVERRRALAEQSKQKADRNDRIR